MLSFRKKVFFSQLLFGLVSIAFLSLFLNKVMLCIFFAFLVVHSLLATIVVHHVLRPVQQILNAIRLHKQGKEEFLPRIVLNQSMKSGEFSQLALTFNSLTDRIQKQIEYLLHQREETEEILESIGEGIIATDPSARIIFANRTACRMLGIDQKQILKQTLDLLSGQPNELSKKCHELIVHVLQTSESIVQQWNLKQKGPLYLDLIAAPLVHKDGALLVFRDKTSDHRIVELGKAFVANASHELRTPITIIRGFAETLQDFPKISAATIQDIIEKIARTCGRLDKLVRSLLTLADIENLSENKFKKIDLFPIIENCIHTLSMLNPSTSIQMHASIHSARISADADLLELAIMNILENAVKYSAQAAQIEIFLKSHANGLQLEIKDQGIGIAEKDLPHVFDRFYTVDKARSRKSGGAGLGLSIVKTIIEKHRGKVAMQSELGKGSSVTLNLERV